MVVEEFMSPKDKDQVEPKEMRFMSEYVDKDQEVKGKDGGKKNDKSKLRYDLLPMDVIDDIVDILTYGAEKYEPNNWQGVETYRHYAALQRHLSKYRQGEDYDKESGKHHLSHALCDLVFIAWQRKHNKVDWNEESV